MPVKKVKCGQINGVKNSARKLYFHAKFVDYCMHLNGEMYQEIGPGRY